MDFETLVCLWKIVYQNPFRHPTYNQAKNIILLGNGVFPVGGHGTADDGLEADAMSWGKAGKISVLRLIAENE